MTRSRTPREGFARHHHADGMEVGHRPRQAAGALLLGLALCHPGCIERAPDREPPNVLIVLVDTLRKDHLGLYGYRRDNPHAPFGLRQRGPREYSDGLLVS